MTAMGGKICKEPIYLRINKRDFFDLTLVDLPGLTYLDGLAPFIAGIYSEHIQNQNSIILYVSSAKTDLVTGQSMEIVNKHDPEWNRSMTIVTKIDGRDSNFINNFRLVDRGLGAFCVRNRTESEIKSGISFSDVLEKEKLCLKDEDFSEISEQQKGIPMLIEALIGH